MANTMDHPLRFLRIPEVQHRVGLGKTKIYGMIKDGDFPAPIKRGRSSLWRNDDIEHWIMSHDRPAPSFEDLL